MTLTFKLLQELEVKALRVRHCCCLGPITTLMPIVILNSWNHRAQPCLKDSGKIPTGFGGTGSHV